MDGRRDMNDQQTGETRELKGVRKTSEQVKAECDAWVALGNEPEQIDSFGQSAATNQDREVEKLARNWIARNFSERTIRAKAKKLDINFKLVIAERERRKTRGNKS